MFPISQNGPFQKIFDLKPKGFGLQKYEIKMLRNVKIKMQMQPWTA